MSQPLTNPGYRRILPEAAMVYVVIIFWEMLTLPTVSTSSSWNGVSISLAMLPVGAYSLARHPGALSRFFVFGVAGSFLFLIRFLGMNNFSLWLEYQAPSTEAILFCWILFALGMGCVCWFAAKLRRLHDAERCREPHPF